MRQLLYHNYNNKICVTTHEAKVKDQVKLMVLKIDFNSEEAIYIQLRNQIVIGIATSQIEEGEPLPSVRQMADHIGINMHTVNKAYSVLKQDGFVKLDRRRGAYVAVDYDKCLARQELFQTLQIVLAEAICKNISRDEVHEIIDSIYDFYEKKDRPGNVK